MSEEDQHGVVLSHRAAETAALLHMINTVSAGIEKMDQRLSKHMEDETKELAVEIAKLLNSAFPGGDAGQHRREHEASIKRAESVAAFWQMMSRELAKWGLLGFIGWGLAAVWRAFLMGPK